jgi:polyisoprenoid-binding protein YceI
MLGGTLSHHTHAAGNRPDRRGIAPFLLAAGLAVWIGASPLTGPSPASAAPPVPSSSGTGVEHFAILPFDSTVTYHVGETFFEENRFAVAVGTTHAVQGDVYVDRVHPGRSRIGPVTIDISTFQSNSGRRDRAIRNRWLESSRYPTAEFTPTAIRGLPARYTDGQDIAVQVLGTLRVRDVTRPVTFAGTVRLAGDMMTGAVRTTILMTDFGFQPPEIFGTLKAENQVQLDLQFTAKRAA